MNKVAVAVAVVLLLALAQASQAATLQAGWYAKLSGVSLYGFNPQTGRDEIVDWTFSGVSGSYGPFVVTTAESFWPQCIVSVPATTTVPLGTSVALTGQPQTMIGFALSSLSFTYDTSYDATQMRLSLYVQHIDGSSQLLYSETRSGQHSVSPSIQLGPTTYVPSTDSLVFKVATVPEPPQLLALGMPLVAVWLKRRVRR